MFVLLGYSQDVQTMCGLYVVLGLTSVVRKF